MLYTRIKQDKDNARRAKDTATATSLITLLGEMETIAKRSGSDITDELAVQIITKFIKGLNETVKSLSPSDDRYDAALTEITMLNVYLPVLMTKSELISIIKNMNYNNIGQYMKALKEQYSGKYDAKMASTIIKNL